MYKKVEKYLAYIMLIIMCVSMLPIMYLGRYNHPTGDDYYYGMAARQVIDAGGNMIEVIGAALKGVAQEYMIWQGTYSAMFLMHLPPNVFHEALYGLVTTGIVILFVSAVFFFLKQIICLWMKGSRYLWIFLSSLYVLLSLQTLPFVEEALYWCNGSMYYTGFFSITLFFWGIVVRYLLCPKKYHMPVLAFLALFLAGGNYVSLLPCILLLITLTALLVLKRSRKSVGIAVLVVLMIIGLIVSAVAPGNQVRQARYEQLTAVEAVIKSIRQGFRYVEGWTNLWLILVAVFITPFIWRLCEQNKFRFRYPVIVWGYAFGIFCSMGCPTFYAMNSTGGGRILAIVYYGFMAFMLFCYCYLVGYLNNLLKRIGKTLEWNRWPKAVISLAVVILLLVQIAGGKVQESNMFRAIRVLESGEAVAYEKEYKARLEILRDDSVQDVVFQPYVNQPDMIYVGDFTGNISDPNNVRIARYWGKNTIRVDY